ncbi:MAG: glycoside hydrolase [Planctomycetota bacterium]|nr:MAG: glycoside hydrolase [Planctomycetota bacterium]
MGLIRFAVCPADRLSDWPEVHAGYLTGSDGRVHVTRIEVIDHVIGCRRSASDSVKFHVLWPVKGLGRVMISTASLSERDEPYLLAVELARGKLVQVRNQVAQWELIGLKVPEAFAGPYRAAHQAFSRGAASQGSPEAASLLAEAAIVYACEAADILVRAYSMQALAGRMQRFGTLPVLVGCELHGAVPVAESTELFQDLFNSATVAVPWKEIEPSEGKYNWDVVDRQLDWCEAQKIMVRGGPLLDLGPGGLPDWLAKWEHDYANLQSFVCDFVETAISRYVGRIRTWEICTGISTGGALRLTEENRLVLAARVFDVARQVDEEAQLIIRIDQPWNDYQSRSSYRCTPLQMVDALIRSGIGLSGVHLELAVGYQPHGSARRDLLDCSRWIEAWSTLDIPIFVTLVAPSSSSPDLGATAGIQANGRVWEGPCDEDHQAEWIERMIELLIAKMRVAGLFLPNFSDHDAHPFPHSGLMRADQTSKPLVERILAQRSRHLRKI